MNTFCEFFLIIYSKCLVFYSWWSVDSLTFFKKFLLVPLIWNTNTKLVFFFLFCNLMHYILLHLNTGRNINFKRKAKGQLWNGAFLNPLRSKVTAFLKIKNHQNLQSDISLNRWNFHLFCQSVTIGETLYKISRMDFMNWWWVKKLPITRKGR